METLTKEARELRNAKQREYGKKYRQKMTEEQKERRREYRRRWSAANRDKCQAAQARYWNRQAELMTSE